ncbi:MAG TPA: SRPBCC family protein [Dehalococcoidia bacterium]|nr:SRPBCC family protein [Dehalococcoidia bacterium]
MPANEYRFITRWRLTGAIEEVAAILGDPLDLPRWWPAVYLAVHELAPGDARGLGRVVDLHTRGWLPYTLRWRFQVTELDPPRRIALDASGDFVGRGVWTLEQDGETASRRLKGTPKQRIPRFPIPYPPACAGAKTTSNASSSLIARKRCSTRAAT